MVTSKIKSKIKYFYESVYKFLYIIFFIDKKQIHELETFKFDKLNFNEQKAEDKLNGII